MELVADLRFILKKSNSWDFLRDYGFIQEVTGPNGKNLNFIKESTQALVTMKPRNMKIKEGLSFTIRDESLDQIREAARLLYSLLEKVKGDFREYLSSKKAANNVVEFEMETSKAWCGKCNEGFSTFLDLEDHADTHGAPRESTLEEIQPDHSTKVPPPITSSAQGLSSSRRSRTTHAREKRPHNTKSTGANSYVNVEQVFKPRDKPDNTTEKAEQSTEQLSPESKLKRKLQTADDEEPPAKQKTEESDKPQVIAEDPDLTKALLQDSLKRRENAELDDIQTLMIINRIKRKLHYKDKEDISSRVASIVKYMNMRRETGNKVDATELLTVNLKVAIKTMAEKLNYDMTTPAVSITPPNSAVATLTQASSTPPMSPSVAPNTPPKLKSSSINIKLTYNQPQSSQEKSTQADTNQGGRSPLIHVVSVPNPLEKVPSAQAKGSSPASSDIKKLNLPTTTAIRKSTQPSNGRVSKQEQKAVEFDVKFSEVKNKMPSFLEDCLTGKIERDFTETVNKLKDSLSDEGKQFVVKTYNREINLWQAKFKKKIPGPTKQALHLKVAWTKCQERLEGCPKEEKGDLLPVLEMALQCLGGANQGTQSQNEETEKVMIDWGRKLGELKKKIETFLDHCLSEDDVSYDLSETITKLNDVLDKEDRETMTKALNRQINVLQQKEKKKVNFSTRQALHLKVVWNTCYKKFNQNANKSGNQGIKDMKSEYRDCIMYTLKWVDDWYFDGKAPKTRGEQESAIPSNDWTFQSTIPDKSNGSLDARNTKSGGNLTYIQKQLEELNEKFEPFLKECYQGRGPDLMPTIRKLENKLTPVQKENIEVELNKEVMESEKKVKRHLKDCERDVLHLRIVWKSCYDLFKIGAKGNNPECRGMIVSLLLWVKNENKSIESDSKDEKKDVDLDACNSWLDETSDSKDMSTIPSHLDKDLKEHLIQRESGKLTNGKTLSVIRTLKLNLSPQEKSEIGKLISTAHLEEAKLKGTLDASEKISIHLRVTCDFIQNRRRRALVNFR